VKRRRVTILAAGSGLLFLLVVSLWIRSAFKSESIRWQSALKDPPSMRYSYALTSAHGILDFYRGDFEYFGHPKESSTHWATQVRMMGQRVGWSYVAPSYLHHAEGWLGVGFRHEATGVLPGDGTSIDQNEWVLTIPYWLLALITISPSLFVAYRVRIKSRKIGRCAKCGYDLRATPDRCPECGTARAAESSTGSTSPPTVQH
jgi:hypothetical protein